MLTATPADESEASDEDERPRRDRDTSDDDEAADYSEDGMDIDGDRNDNQLAKKLIRYAISCEYSRTLIRRDGIKERGRLGLFDLTLALPCLLTRVDSSRQPGAVL